MKDAPFNLTTVLLGTLLAVTVAGGILGLLFSAAGLTGFWGIFLSAFLTVPLGSVVRQAVARGAAEHAGVKGRSPMAFSLPVRLLIGAVAAAGIAYLFSLSEFYSLGFVMGAAAALATGLILTVIFFVKVAFGD